MEILISYLFVSFILGLVVAFVAEKRGHSAGAFLLLSLVLSPLVGFAVAVAIPAKSK